MMHVSEIKDQAMDRLIDRSKGIAMAIEDIITRNSDCLSDDNKRDLNKVRIRLLNSIVPYETARSR